MTQNFKLVQLSHVESVLNKWSETAKNYGFDGDADNYQKILAEISAAPDVAGESVITLAMKNAELQKRIEQLEDLLSSAYNIANRSGADTHWLRFAAQLHVHGISPVTAKTFKILPSDEGYQPSRTAELEDKVKRLVEALRKAQPACVIASDFKYDDGDEDASQEWNIINVTICALLAEIGGGV